VADGRSGNSPGINLPSRTLINLRSSLIIKNLSIFNLFRVHFIHTELGESLHLFFYFFLKDYSDMLNFRISKGIKLNHTSGLQNSLVMFT
jgi:hypothetical protein